MKTHQVTPDQIVRRWYLVDAEDQTLGRLASRVAHEQESICYCALPYSFVGDEAVMELKRLNLAKRIKRLWLIFH